MTFYPSWIDVFEWSENLKLFFEKYYSKSCNINGDIHINMLHYEFNSALKYFTEMFTSYNLLLCNKIRICPSILTLIDVICNEF